MSARILIIEDNTANMDLMAYLLQACGHTPLQSGDGASGIEAARREKPDLVVCDVHLPDLDGYGVVAALKADAATREVPVIAVTALAMAGDRERLLRSGFDAYLSKPIEPEQLVAEVERFLPDAKRSTGMHRLGQESRQYAAPVQPRHARILVVDDTAVNSELIRSTLAPFGYELTLASDVPEALDELRRTRYDLILSDLHMPGEDGFALLEAVKADPALAALPFLFLSASFGGMDEFRRGIALGAARFIRRPVEPPALLEHIEACLQEARGKDVDGDHPDR